MTRKTVLVSVSGGRTSGFMAWWMKEFPDLVAEYLEVDEVDYEFVFANTGLEHEDTLRFLDRMDREFKLGIVWVEGEAHHGIRKRTSHRVVTYETAFRRDQYKDVRHPFHDHIRKYGVPNVKFKGCTREMKLNPIRSYMRSQGHTNFATAVGIRADEKRRVSKNAHVREIIYPLVDLEPVDKDDIIEWWSTYDWDLRIPEWFGNCVTCYKKSFKKLKKVWEEDPGAFEFNAEMERRYPRLGPEFKKDPSALDRTFFRMNTPTRNLLKIFQDTPDVDRYIRQDDAGCSESCELYETEIPDDA